MKRINIIRIFVSLPQIKKFLVIITLTLALGLNFSYCQRIDTLLNEYGASCPVERLYLQFDKTLYAPGETIWFKAYIVSVLMPDADNKNLYVDFSDATGKVVAHNIYPVTEGLSRGQFTIPESARGNLVHVRAYTKWMLNFDSAFLFNKNLALLHPKSNRNRESFPEPKVSVYFFPEGGDIIANLKTRIAFMAENQFGQPVNITGVVKDNEDKTVSDLIVQHDGMGSFYLVPEAGKKYFASWKDQKGNEYNTGLPAIKSSGISLSMNSTGNKKQFRIERSDDTSSGIREIHVVAMMYQQVVYMANLLLESTKSISGLITTKNFPSGIMQFTVFDKNWEPLAERIIYVKNNADVFHPDIQLSELNFGKRGQNELTITTNDSSSANLSISVTDAAMDVDNSSNIVSYMLLSSQIKGKIYHPYYYFSDTTAAINNALDLVMLTHGWRRFEWKNILTKAPLKTTFAPDTSYMIFSGKVSAVTPKQLASAQSLLTIIKSGSNNKGKGSLFYLPLYADGSFRFPGMILFDTLLVSYKFIGNKDLLRDAHVELMSDKLKAPIKVPVSITDSMEAQNGDTSALSTGKDFYNRYAGNNIKTLKEVTVYTKIKTPLQKLDELYASPLFQREDAHIFDVENDISAHSAVDVLHYLQNRVAGLEISNLTGSNANVRMRGFQPTFFLDEIPVDTPLNRSILQDINMFDVAMIKVFSPPFLAAWGNGSGGAVAIYTKKANARQNVENTNMMYKKMEGYSPIREFYSPDYLINSKDADIPDTRTTLYWNSTIATTSRQHEVKLRFYNNDFTKSYRIILEGMNTNGQFTHLEKIYQ